METSPQLVRTLLALVAVGFSPVLLLGAVIALAILIARLRGKRASDPPSRGSLRSADAMRVARRMKRNKQTSLRLVAAHAGGFSKLGGSPDLPRDLEWPAGPEGALRFLAQLDLGAVRASGGPDWLPPEGRLYLFFDDRFGEADQVRVLYASTDAQLVSRPPQDASAWPLHERGVAFTAQESLPSLDWLAEDPGTLEMDDDELAALTDLAASKGPSPQHRIGGYPEEIQDEQMALSCERATGATGEEAAMLRRAVRTWKLLAQIDSDGDLGTSFGDSGRLYVFVRASEAQQGQFANTVTLYQSA